MPREGRNVPVNSYPVPCRTTMPACACRGSCMQAPVPTHALGTCVACHSACCLQLHTASIATPRHSACHSACFVLLLGRTSNKSTVPWPACLGGVFFGSRKTVEQAGRTRVYIPHLHTTLYYGTICATPCIAMHFHCTCLLTAHTICILCHFLCIHRHTLPKDAFPAHVYLSTYCFTCL